MIIDNESKYTIGMRTFKTALAVFFCLFLRFFMGNDGASIAAVSAIIGMQATRTETIKTGTSRIIGTFIGGIIAYIYLVFHNIIPYEKIPFSLDWLPYLTIPLFTLISIYICNLLRIKEASTICAIVLIVVVLGLDKGNPKEIIYHVIIRVLATLIGIIIAMIINRFIAPYNPKKERSK